jgi:hypothetical protein
MKNNSTAKPTLAQLLSDVLHHPDLPAPMHCAIQEAITVVFNQHIDQSEIEEFETSPAYIEMIIRGYQKRVANNPLYNEDVRIEGGVQ